VSVVTTSSRTRRLSPLDDRPNFDSGRAGIRGPWLPPSRVVSGGSRTALV